MKLQRLLNKYRLFLLAALFFGCASIKEDSKLEASDSDVLVRFNLDSDSVRFDNLRFFKVFAKAKPGRQYKEYVIERTYFSFGENVEVVDGDRVNKELRDKLFSSQSELLSIDSVLLSTPFESGTFCEEVDLSVHILFPRERSFECLDSDDHFLFRNLISGNTNEIVIDRDTSNCNIIEFDKLGTLSSVEISSNGENVYTALVKNGVRSIDYFFNFSSFSELHISITGDYMWDGEIKIIN